MLSCNHSRKILAIFHVLHLLCLPTLGPILYMIVNTLLPKLSEGGTHNGSTTFILLKSHSEAFLQNRLASCKLIHWVNFHTLLPCGIGMFSCPSIAVGLSTVQRAQERGGHHISRPCTLTPSKAP